MTEKPRTRVAAALRTVGAGAVVLVVLAFIAVFFVVPGPMISTAARTGQGMLFAEIDGRDAVIIAYDDNGFSGLGIFASAGHDSRIAAFDLESGETIWNRGLDDGPAFLVRMIVAGDEYGYLETTTGLTVIALADGATVATDEDISGLGDVDTLTTVFAVSPSRNAIMASTEEGVVREITIDTLEAVDVDAAVRDTWSCVLAWNGRGYSESDAEAVLVDRMPVGGDVLGFGVASGSPPGTPGKRLTRLNDDGSGRTVGGESFVDPGFVAQSLLLEPASRACPGAHWDDDVFPDGRTVAQPLGADAGFAVIDHAQNARAEERQISIVDAADGTVLASSPAEGGMVDAGAAPSGQSVVVTDRFLPGVLPNWTTTAVTSTVLLISPEGAVREIVLAPHGWLGLPW